MLLAELVRRQQELGEPDGIFASRLGIPRTTWVVTRNKTKPLGRRVASGAARAFPELRELAASFLLGDDTSVTDPDTCGTVEAVA